MELSYHDTYNLIKKSVEEGNPNYKISPAIFSKNGKGDLLIDENGDSYTLIKIYDKKTKKNVGRITYK